MKTKERDMEMFRWFVSDLALINDNSKSTCGGEKVYTCENKVSREDKIAFLDSLSRNRMSYLLRLMEKWKTDRKKLGNMTSSDVRAWIKENDTRYEEPILSFMRDFITDDYVICGKYDYYMPSFLCHRRLHLLDDVVIDLFDGRDLVDSCFHKQLRICEAKERKYFESHDEYCILRDKLRNFATKYGTTFGVNLGLNNDDKSITVLSADNASRVITMEEIKTLIAQYEKLETYAVELAKEIEINY